MNEKLELTTSLGPAQLAQAGSA